MTDKAITPKYRRASGSSLIEALAEALSAIKKEDGLTDKELASFLGKEGQDSGKAYRTGFAEMPVTAFLRGCEVWNGRFANGALALIGMRMSPLDKGMMSDRASFTVICTLLAKMSEALENDEIIDDEELADMRTAVEVGGQAIDRLRDRLKLKAVA